MSDIEGALQSAAESNEICNTLYANYSNVYEYLESNYYRWVQSNCPYFTDHGRNHIKSVINQASGLLIDHIQKDETDVLKPIDLYLLLTSIIWHDVGMVEHRAGHEDITDITEEVKNIAFPNPGVRSTVEQIVRAHTGDDALQKAKTRSTISVEHRNFSVHPRALAALLRFADEISESQGRVSSSNVVMDQVPDESKIYWEYARSITGVRPDPDRERIIVEIELKKDEATTTYDCPDDYLHRAENGEISLMEYIVCRLEKMNNEKAYCAPEFRRYVDIREIEVRITILDDDRSILVDQNEILGDAGLRSQDPYPDIEIFDEFFNKHESLHPSKIQKA